jgi:signal transduction histidine kinase
VAQGTSAPVVVDPCVVLGRFAGLLAAGTALPHALDALVSGLGLHSAVVRSAVGQLLGVGGEALHAVPQMPTLAAARTSLELPVHGRSGVQTATLTVHGARPSQLPALRSAAAVLGLALVPVTGAAELLDAAEAERDQLADALHDGPVQTLLVARYAADAAVRGGDAALARDAVQEAVVDLRRTLWHLRPRGATGLVAALEQLSAQLVEAGGSPLGLLGDLDADLCGPAAVTAFRVVQAVTRAGAGEALRVALRLEQGTVIVDVDGGAPLPSPERWARRAAALGGDLSASAGRLRLVLPLTATSGDDARTTP